MLFAHVLIGYVITLLKVFTRWWRARQSESWPRATATIVAKRKVTTADSAIIYTYYANGGFYSGTDEKPFFLGRSATKYANQFSKGSNLTVRVKPGDPKVSIIRDLDQVHSQ
jgi:hypothetical protein